MSLSPETINRINHFRRFETLYQPNDDVKQQIGNRTLSMIVGPAAIGKSHIMNRLAELEPSYGRSSTLSTRKPRDDDEPGIFRSVEHTDDGLNGLLDKILSGELVQYKFHPTEHTFYGSETIDHPYRNNMLPTLSGAIDQLKEVGFETTYVVGLVAPPTSWKAWFDQRYPLRHPMRLRRLEEAEISYNDLLLRTDVTWVINREGESDAAAQQIVEASEPNTHHSDEAAAYVHRILQLTQDAKRYAQAHKYE